MISVRKQTIRVTTRADPAYTGILYFQPKRRSKPSNCHLAVSERCLTPLTQLLISRLYRPDVKYRAVFYIRDTCIDHTPGVQ